MIGLEIPLGTPFMLTPLFVADRKANLANAAKKGVGIIAKSCFAAVMLHVWIMTTMVIAIVPLAILAIFARYLAWFWPFCFAAFAFIWPITYISITSVYRDLTEPEFSGALSHPN